MTQTRKINIQQLVEELKSQNLKKHDIVVPSSCLKFEDGRLIVKNTDGNNSLSELLQGTGITTTDLALDVLDYCHRLIGDKLGIPRSYYDKMKDGHFNLLDTNVNHWLGESKSNYFLRSFIDKDEQTGFARALLSDRYNVIDNYDVLFAALEAIRKSDTRLEIEYADITETKMYIRFVCPEVEVKAPDLLMNYRVPNGGGGSADTNTGIISGFVISNSEVGAGSFSISPRAVVLACKNGMIFKDDAFNKVHLGAKMDEYSSITWSQETKRKNYELIMAQVGDAIKTFISPEYLGARINRLMEAGLTQLKHPIDAVKNVCKVNSIGDEKEAEILKYFVQGGDTTAFGVTQAITFYAHETTNADEQDAMEELSTQILESVPTFDKPFVTATRNRTKSNPALN